jgi:hypothetical protein
MPRNVRRRSSLSRGAEYDPSCNVTVACTRDGAMRHPRDAPALGYGLASLSVVVGGGIFTLIRKAGMLGAHTAQARRVRRAMQNTQCATHAARARRVRRAMQYMRCGVRM